MENKTARLQKGKRKMVNDGVPIKRKAIARLLAAEVRKYR